MTEIERDHPVYRIYDKQEVELAAKVGHNAMQAVCEMFNVPKLNQWELCHENYRQSIIRQVEQYLCHAKSCRTVHNSWVKHMVRQGWSIGERDRENETHPHLVDFNELPVEIRLKLKVFRASVMGFRKNKGPDYDPSYFKE